MRTVIVVLLLVLLAACANAPPRNPLAEWVPSPNFEARRPLIIVLHATEQQSARQSLDTLRSANSKGPVSSHYLVGDDGRIRCGCGWTGTTAEDADEWRAHLADAILEALGRVE